MNFLISYFSIGIGFYLGCAAKEGFKYLVEWRKQKLSIIRGLLMIPLWPLGIYVVLEFREKP